MTIKKTCEKIVNSKEFQDANDEDKVKILIQLCFLTFDQTRINMVRRYGKVKFFTSVHIKSELNRVDMPDINFDIR